MEQAPLADQLKTMAAFAMKLLKALLLVSIQGAPLINHLVATEKHIAKALESHPERHTERNLWP